MRISLFSERTDVAQRCGENIFGRTLKFRRHQAESSTGPQTAHGISLVHSWMMLGMGVEKPLTELSSKAIVIAYASLSVLPMHSLRNTSPIDGYRWIGIFPDYQQHCCTNNSKADERQCTPNLRLWELDSLPLLWVFEHTGRNSTSRASPSFDNNRSKVAHAMNTAMAETIIFFWSHYDPLSNPLSTLRFQPFLISAAPWQFSWCELNCYY